MKPPFPYARWLRYLNWFLVLAIIASLLLRFAFTPSMNPDQQWALEMARNAAQGRGLFSLAHQWQWGRYQYPIDLPIPVWPTRWPPGVALLLLPTTLLGLPASAGVLLLAVLSLTVGFLGWRKLIQELGLGHSDLRWAAYVGVLFTTVSWGISAYFSAESLLNQVLPWYIVYLLTLARTKKIGWLQFVLFGVLLGAGFWLKYSWLAYAGAIGLALLFALRRQSLAQVIRAALLVGAASIVPVVILFAINLYYTGHLTAQNSGAVAPELTLRALLYPLRSILDLFGTADGVEYLYDALSRVLRLPFSWDVLVVALAGVIWLTISYVFYRARTRFTENERIVLLCGYLGWLLTYLMLLVNTLSGHGESPFGDNLLIGSMRFFSHALLLLWICLLVVASRWALRWRVVIVAAVVVGIVLPSFIQESRRFPFFWNYSAGPSGLRSLLPSGADAQLAAELEPLLSQGNTIVLGQNSYLLFDSQTSERLRIWVTNVTNYDPQPICFEQPGRLLAVIALNTGRALDATGVPEYTWRTSTWMGLDSQRWHRLNSGENTAYALLEYGGDIPLCSEMGRAAPEN